MDPQQYNNPPNIPDSNVVEPPQNQPLQPLPAKRNHKSLIIWLASATLVIAVCLVGFAVYNSQNTPNASVSTDTPAS